MDKCVHVLIIMIILDDNSGKEEKNNSYLLWLLVNQIMSNGVYKSIEHRAITNEKKARISAAAFAHVDDELEIGPLDSMVDDPHRPPMYRRIKYIEYMRQVLARQMDGKAHTDLVKIQT